MGFCYSRRETCREMNAMIPLDYARLAKDHQSPELGRYACTSTSIFLLMWFALMVLPRPGEILLTTFAITLYLLLLISVGLGTVAVLRPASRTSLAWVSFSVAVVLAAFWIIALLA